MAAYVPPGWPAGVHPPGSEEFEQTAVTWMLDVVPPDYRLHGVLRRHPLALAVLARHHLAACIQGARDGYRTARTELASLPPGGVDAVLEVYRAEGRRLVETARAVDLVGRALRGEVFTPQLGHGEGRGAGRGRGAPPRAGTRTAAPPREAPPRETPPREAPPREAAREAPPRGTAPREPGPLRSAPQAAPSEAAKRAPAAREATPGTAPRKGTARSGGAPQKTHGAGPSAPKPGRRPAPR